MTTAKVNLASKLALFHDHWKPRTVARLNDYDVMVVKVLGGFVWHTHENTDDFFLVLEGELQVRLRDRTIVLGPGELFVAPRGIEHQTYAERETSLLLIDAYDRACAVTGEHSLPALEAAHIRAYAHSGPHEVRNGLLLRADSSVTASVETIGMAAVITLCTGHSCRFRPRYRISPQRIFSNGTMNTRSAVDLARGLEFTTELSPLRA